MNWPSARLSTAMLAALVLLPSACLAAAGDVSFRAASKTVPLNPGNQNFGIDVFVDVAGGANVPATGWGMIVNITPQGDAAGSVRFNPPTIVNNQPNLMPSSQNAFLDFDRDFDGKSYGMLGQSNTQLRAFSYYVAPVLGPPPSLDANGNLSLPDGKGLLSLPLIASFDASGHFNVTFDPDPVVTGAIFATGMPAPQDVGIHPAGTHVTGVLNIVNLMGDYNRNGVVDAADYTIWRDTLGSTTNFAADGNGNNVIDAGDYSVWKSVFGQTTPSGTGSTVNTAVPEPSTCVMLLVGILTVCSCRRAAMS